MAPRLPLAVRDAAPPGDSSQGATLSPIYIVGISIASSLVGIVVIWCLARYYQERVKTRRINQRGAAFLNVKGIVSDTAISPTSPSKFSRANIDQVVMPKSSKQVLLAYHTRTGTLTQPFRAWSSHPYAQVGPDPSMYDQTADPTPDSPLEPADTPLRGPFIPAHTLNIHAREGSSSTLAAEMAQYSSRQISTVSWVPPTPPPGTPGSRFSLFSRGSSVLESAASGGLGERVVRQVFEPVLPDELPLHVGERIRVVQTLDDGWCVVGRGGVEGIEMGVVPAWVFLKPAKGLRAKRPMRSTSLGVKVKVHEPEHEPEPSGRREKVVSWSNFA